MLSYYISLCETEWFYSCALCVCIMQRFCFKINSRKKQMPELLKISWRKNNNSVLNCIGTRRRSEAQIFPNLPNIRYLSTNFLFYFFFPSLVVWKSCCYDTKEKYTQKHNPITLDRLYIIDRYILDQAKFLTTDLTLTHFLHITYNCREMSVSCHHILGNSNIIYSRCGSLNRPWRSITNGDSYNPRCSIIFEEKLKLTTHERTYWPLCEEFYNSSRCIYTI